ncbi:pyocin knob domain-containing protein [Providencia stuartii]|uniref:pyocin knob domain-containing protein n=2 Tax=Providencia TaxID=586 RepID=UPI0034E50767
MQMIQIQIGNTVHNNSIHSIQSNTELTLNFPIPTAQTGAKYVIFTTTMDSISAAANAIVAMNSSNVQFSDIQNRIMTESGVIDVKLPDGTVRKTRTEAERDKLLDGKFDKTGGVVEGGVTAIALGSTRKQTNSTIYLYPAPESSPDGYAYFQYRIGDNWFGRAEIPRPASNQTTRLMQVGDYGWGAGAKSSSNWNEITENGVYVAASSSQPELPEAMNFLMVLHIQSGYTASQIAFRSNREITSTWRRSKDTFGWGKWYEFYTEANTTKDSNGNLKAASPIVKVFADHIETNEESEGVEMEHLGVGHYLIKGVVGFNADGAWGINNGFVIPQDHNGKNMVLIDYKVRPDGDIEVFVFHQQNADLPERFQNKRIKYIDKDGNPVYYENYEPCDVPESRWIDMRVEMPVNSIYNLKKAEAERLAKEEAERQAEEAKNAEIEAEEDI